ncbi:hypothetical protein ACIQZO_01185 [Streptomyces sp. NPDC097617]|uniref:hypothetical protein n=1 Tax=Streptomyces sp. NPDC097617 TaxID=3366091 RepID=UPI0037FF27A1
MQDMPDTYRPLGRTATGTGPPVWLTLDQARLDLVVDWIGCPTWADARAFWDRHAALLRSPDVSWVLEELSAVSSVAGQRLQVVHEAVATDPDSAFEPHLRAEHIAAWTKIGPLDESRIYLTAHQDFLLSDPVVADFDSSAVGWKHFALATLARADGITRAYTYVQDRSALRTRLAQLLEAPEAPAVPDLLLAVGLLEMAVHNSFFTGQVHVQLATVLAGKPLGELDWRESTPAERDHALDDIWAVMKRHDGDHADLTTLIASIRTAASAQPL